MSAQKLKKMVEEGLIEARTTPTGNLRFSRQALSVINPRLLSDKTAINQRYLRPKRLITPVYLKSRQNKVKGNLMETYLRDARGSIGFCKGFQGDVAGTLNLMIDLMALHYEDGGIPAEPVTYIAGALGLASTRKWVQTIEPVLVASGRIKKVSRNGIKVWVFPEDMMSGPKALFRPLLPNPGPLVHAQDPGNVDARSLAWDEIGGDIREPLLESELAPNPGRIMPVPETYAEALKREAQPHGPTEIAIDAADTPDRPMPRPAPPPVTDNPTPVADIPPRSAYEVLKQAGIDVDEHERGLAFWHRIEHGEILSRWLETVPLNEIVVRLDKARIAGILPSYPNGLLAYEDIVLDMKS